MCRGESVSLNHVGSGGCPGLMCGPLVVTSWSQGSPSAGNTHTIGAALGLDIFAPPWSWESPGSEKKGKH
jgi:hypothetical protein